MSTIDLCIEPTELKFPFVVKKQSSCSLQLTNKTDKYVAFKVKLTNPKKYCVRPNAGIVLPGTTCDVTVTMQAQKEAPPDLQCKDKFLLQSVTLKDIMPEMFNKEDGKVIGEFKLRVVYFLANPPSPVLEGSDEGSSPRASVPNNGNQSSPLIDAVSRSLGEMTVNSVDMSIGDLSIEPTELKFPFEVKKQSSCSLQLTNKTDKYVAFKVKTTNPKKYCVRPNAGIVLPGTTCDVTVTMQAQKEAPPDLQCKDKFLLQSVTLKDIMAEMAEMFNKEDGKVIGEFKLRVVYFLANPPSPIPEGSDEGSSPRASVPNNGNQSSPFIDALSRFLEEVTVNSSEASNRTGGISVINIIAENTFKVTSANNVGFVDSVNVAFGRGPKAL